MPTLLVEGRDCRAGQPFDVPQDESLPDELAQATIAIAGTPANHASVENR
jgi:hypothetical protein